MDKSPYCGFWAKKWPKQGKQADDWLVEIISGLWGIVLSLIVWYLGLGA